MIEGLFWLVIISVAVFVVDHFMAAPRPDASPEQVEERKELVIDRALVSVVVGIVVFFVVGYLFF